MNYELDNIYEMVDIDKYIKSLDKWYNTIQKKFFILIDGPIGCGKSTLSKLYLKHKNYKVLYFDATQYKSKNMILSKIKDSFDKNNISSYFVKEEKKIGYIIDNINNIISKNDISELYNLFKKKNIYRPIIFIGSYDKNLILPKKKIEYLKLFQPTKNTLINISNNFIKKYNINLSTLKLNIFASKCDYDIRKLLHFILYNNNTPHNKLIFYSKDKDFNLFNIFNNLILSYNKVDNNSYYEHSTVLNYLYHQNLYNIMIENYKKKKLKTDLSYFYKIINNNIIYENYYLKYNNLLFKDYLYINSCKNISYLYNKNKINKNVVIKIDYPKSSFISNQKNIYKKYVNLFKNFDFYYILNEQNIILFIKSLFKDEIINKHIFDKLDTTTIIQLRKLINP